MSRQLPTNDEYTRDVLKQYLAAIRKLRGVCKQVSEHVDELVDAWMSGALVERDGKGGTRSNRNWELSAKLRAALEQTKEFEQP